MKNKYNTRFPLWLVFLLVFTLMGVGLFWCPLPKLDINFEKGIAVVGVILALIAASSTVYSIGMSHDITKYRSEIGAYRSMYEKLNDDMRFQLHETINVLETIESVAGDKMVYVRLSEGRILCKSKYSDDNDKMKGIALIQKFYDSKNGINEDNEDVKLLKHLSEDYEVKEVVRTAASKAVDKILKKEEPPITEPQRDNVSDMERIAKNAVERLKRFLKKIYDTQKKTKEGGGGN